MSEQENEQLEKILHSLAREAKPEKHFEQMLRTKLRERFYTNFEANTSRQKKFWNIFTRFKLQLSAAFILAIFTSTTMFAYASDDITNGHILYPLKRSAEKVEGIFANSPESKTGYYNKMAVRRMRELAVLEKKGIKDEITIKETSNLLAKAELTARDVPDEAIDDQIKDTTPTIIRNDAPTEPSFPINLAKEASPLADEAIQVSKHKRTKREKAIEEITLIRMEFENEFNPKKIKNTKEIISPINLIQPVEITKPIIIEQWKPKEKNDRRKTEEKDKTEKKDSEKIEDNKDLINPPLQIIPPIEIADPIVQPIIIPTTIEEKKEKESKTEIEKVDNDSIEEPEFYNLKELKKELKRLQKNKFNRR